MTKLHECVGVLFCKDSALIAKGTAPYVVEVVQQVADPFPFDNNDLESKSDSACHQSAAAASIRTASPPPDNILWRFMRFSKKVKDAKDADAEAR